MDGSRFLIIHNEELRDIHGKPSFASCSIIVDRRTGVNYLQPSNGGLTVLVDADGKPIISREYIQR